MSSSLSYRGLFLLHFEPRYRHAGHYLGYAKRDIRAYARAIISGQRFAPHPLVEHAIAAGCELTIAAVYPGSNRQDRRRLRALGGLARICPICREASGPT